MRNLLAKGMHTLCMLKVTEKTFYRYQGENLHLAAIYLVIPQVDMSIHHSGKHIFR